METYTATVYQINMATTTFEPDSPARVCALRILKFPNIHTNIYEYWMICQRILSFQRTSGTVAPNEHCAVYNALYAFDWFYWQVWMNNLSNMSLRSISAVWRRWQKRYKRKGKKTVVGMGCPLRPAPPTEAFHITANSIALRGKRTHNCRDTDRRSWKFRRETYPRLSSLLKRTKAC